VRTTATQQLHSLADDLNDPPGARLDEEDPHSHRCIDSSRMELCMHSY